MKLEVVVKQDTQKVIKIDDIKHYFFDKNYLVVACNNGSKSWYKASTVLEIQES